MTQPSQAKIALDGPHDDIETQWANVVGDHLYELDNLPWYAYGVSLGDIVEAQPDSSGQLQFVRVVRKAGNRTIRVILEVTPDGEQTFESKQTLRGVVERGCSFEGADRVLVAINIPPAVDLAGIADYLTETGFEWEYADPTYEDLFPGEPSESDDPVV